MSRIRTEGSQWNKRRKGVYIWRKKKKKGAFMTKRTYNFCVPVCPYIDFFKRWILKTIVIYKSLGNKMMGLE